ncbi:hypothetical protein WJX73_004817 [Symbiochloris irregularis]|uniref:F-box domain-containing protein n=1 Tax=Symbiochloris irregularis TaxID=706552 RepID=A0AAW1NSN4_9CHLO
MTLFSHICGCLGLQDAESVAARTKMPGKMSQVIERDSRSRCNVPQHLLGECQPCTSLQDDRMRLPLELSITPQLPVEAVANLTCTCRSLRFLLRSNFLERDWWHQVALEKLGPMHPVLRSTTGLPASRDALRAAVDHYASASARMQAGIYDRKVTSLSLGLHPHLKVSPDGTMLSAFSANSIQVYDTASFGLLSKVPWTPPRASVTASVSQLYAWAEDGSALVIVRQEQPHDHLVCERVCLTTQAVLTRAEMDCTDGRLSAHGRYFLCKPLDGLVRVTKPVKQTASGDELLHIPMHRLSDSMWCPHDDDRIAVIVPGGHKAQRNVLSPDGKHIAVATIHQGKTAQHSVGEWESQHIWWYHRILFDHLL